MISVKTIFAAAALALSLFAATAPADAKPDGYGICIHCQCCF